MVSRMDTQELLAGLSVIAGLVVLEGLLSVDNVLGIAALANELPGHQQKRAIRVGLFLAYLFRVLALFVAGWLATNTWVRWLGAGYLIYIGAQFLLARSTHEAAAEVPSGSGACDPFRQGMICNLTNPTTLVFMLAVLPQFVHASAGSSAMQFLILGATMKATGILSLGTVALASGTVKTGWSRPALAVRNRGALPV